ncbi:MFS family permease [Methylobacterium sp. PvP062]|jgi:MFS family permease|uniref:Major facilitator superfamily MFS_1 n=2 Tax=Methylobacterium radiotolerans TaxID=31998 RepID=B1M8K2_METRJ|nr:MULTISPECIES: MFS transporter [Methylobacterium]MCX7335386.1 MFS transporter [Hyphomicrobiales bacterium]GAN48094.1 major facilitator transporter [Methylobacterium sp. ME121]ACB27827.1 major facilitator superfamily MFS_1 [Methylobacterium radiotolerans JCM 2831]KZB99876.1 Multidrug resistance protein MdtL [Methylobacterium radiotolerans]MBN6819301.1 MFS transporter [Methylobacterium organophilum]
MTRVGNLKVVAVAGGGTLFFHAAVLGTFLAASAAPTPLYRFYQETYALSPVLTTAVFAVYALALLKALLVAGSISDHLGRRPVICGALLLELVAMVLFTTAHGAWGLIAARFVQGVATGIAASSLGAALVDVDRGRAQLVNAIMPLIGMAVGALGTSALVQYGPHPLRLVYAILGAVFVAQAALLWLTPETGERRTGALRALRPRVVVPPQARRPLAAITPTNIATWMLGGFYLSIVPSLVVAATGSRTPLTSGVMVAALMVAGACAVVQRRGGDAAANLTIGTLAMTTGLVIVLAGMHGGSVPVLIGGTLVGGAGFGTSFLGALGTIVPLAKPGERAGLLSTYYVESYLAFSLPVICAGYLVRRIGYVTTADIYAAAIVAMSAAGFLARRAMAARRVLPG